jgi:hypothetical protein
MLGKIPNQFFDHHSDHPRYRQPSPARVYLAGRSEKRKYSPQLGSHLGNPGLTVTLCSPLRDSFVPIALGAFLELDLLKK